MAEQIDATQECRVYNKDTWCDIVEYVLFHKHCKPYLWVAEQAADARVLDFGCGSGYGSALLAGKAREVVAVDASESIIEACRRDHQGENLVFEKIPPGGPLPYEPASFDWATSFQVIEHMPDVPAYLTMLRGMLKPGGRLVLTTCNREFRLFPWQRPWQEAHYREYDPDMMREEISAVFDHFELKGLAATGKAHELYVNAYRPRLHNALLKYPLRRAIRAALPEDVYTNWTRKREERYRAKQTSPLSPEQLAAYSQDDWYVTDDLDRALDLVVVAHA